MSKKPISEYPVHPAAEVFPLMTEQVYAEFKEDIRLHGQREKIIVRGKELIDGRHRLRACLELGIEPVWSELPKTEDPIAWIVSHNRHRRHETTAQRALVAAKLAPLILGDNQHRKEGSGIPLSHAAEQLNVSIDSVKQARKVLNNASADVIAEVEAGKLSLNAAVATTKASDAEKKAKAKAKAAKDKEKADAKAAREKAKAEKAAEKAAKEAAKAKAKADREAALAASRTTEGRIKNIKNLIQQHIDKAVRLVDDLANVKPVAHAKKMEIIRTLQGIKTW